LDYASVDPSTHSQGLATAKVRPASHFGEIIIDVFEQSELIEGVVAKGEIRIQPEYDLFIQIEDFEVKHFELVNKTKIKSDLKIESSLEFAKINEKIKVKEIFFVPKTIHVGSLPVVITPVLTVYVGLDGEISVGISTGVVNETQADIAATYNGSNWNIVGDLVSNNFSEIPQNTKLATHSKAYVRPRLDLWIYGVPGPYGQVDGYVNLTIDPPVDPWWMSSGGVEGLIGVEFKIFKFLPVTFISDPIILVPETEIARAPIPINTPTPTNTVTPTQTPDPTRTNTPAVAALNPTITPSNTIRPGEPPNVTLIYDDFALSLINISQNPISVVEVDFKRISNENAITAVFNSKQWEEFSQKPLTALPSGDCFAVSTEVFSRPAECNSIWSWVTTGQSRLHFWRLTPGNEKFQVYQDGDPIHMCQIADGACTFYLPQP